MVWSSGILSEGEEQPGGTSCKISAHNAGSVIQDGTTAHAMDIKLSKRVHLSLSEEGPPANSNFARKDSEKRSVKQKRELTEE